MTLYSDAALALAEIDCIYAGSHVHSKGCAVAHAYDAGHAAAYREPATFTITEGHSPAAAAYAATRWVVDSNGYHEAAQSFDAGAGAAGVTVRAEPITTAAHLDALPVGSIVLNGDGRPWWKHEGEWWLAGSDMTNARNARGVRGVCTTMTLVYDPTRPASPPVPAPVLLTADDPRWRDGAKVRGEFEDGSAVEGRLSIRPSVTEIVYYQGGRGVRRCSAVYLLAEVNPDADVLDAMEQTEGERSDEALAHLRSRGFDVVKAAN